MNVYSFFMAFICFISLFWKGEALQCWECSSDTYGRCADYFNTTNFPRTSLVYSAVTSSPRLVNCDIPPGPQDQKLVCLKRVETDARFQRTVYTRGCHYLVADEKVGTYCPSHPSYNDITVDYCKYCDTQECNGAQNLQTKAFWMSLLAIVGALFLPK